MSARAPFDPGDARDAMAESFRLTICNMVLDAQHAAIFREMDTAEQAQAIMAGGLTGLVGVLFAMCHPDGHDELITAIADYLPDARANAEAIMAEVA